MRPALLLLPLLLAGCSREEAPLAEATTEATPPVPAASVAATPTPAASAVAIAEATKLFSFDYSYPAAAAAIPALKALLDQQAAETRAELATGAREEHKSLTGSDMTFHAHSRETAWQVVTDLPGWLSLSATASSFTGGAHPNHWFEAMLWDKVSDRKRAATDLFTSKAALAAAIQPAFCAELNRQRSKKRGEPVSSEGGEEGFDACLDPTAYPLILGSSTGTAFNRIGVLVPPYEAGPYAEGDYEVTLPVTAAVLKTVKPEYRQTFASAR